MNTKFVFLCEFARYAIDIFMEYSYRMNNGQSVVGGGGVIVLIFVM